MSIQQDQLEKFQSIQNQQDETNPTDSTNPANSINPINHTNPVNPINPTDSINPTNPKDESAGQENQKIITKQEIKQEQDPHQSSLRSNLNLTSSHSIDQNWSIKQIFWPPFQSNLNSKPRQISIIMQNLNGPCSLLAICNILLLRGLISLPGPKNRKSISFSTLSSILANFLVNQSIPPHQLNTSLSTIPKTQTGLDLNPLFNSINGFNSNSNSSDNGIDLFSAVGIPLVHGWLADPQDLQTWNLVVKNCGDYDKLVESIAIADELIQSQKINQIQLSDLQLNQIHDANILRNFLESTSTQLSYHGLFQLSSELIPDSLAALLRNSHLSVLYRRPFIKPVPPLPPPPHKISPNYDHQTVLEVQSIAQQLNAMDLGISVDDHNAQDDTNLPKLFTLVTDISFINEPEIVWESLEDVEGGLSEFYDWKLCKSKLKTSAVHTTTAHHQSNPAHRTHQNLHSNNPIQENITADYALANQLQQKEYRDAERARLNRHSALSSPPLTSISSPPQAIPNSYSHNQIPINQPSRPPVPSGKKKKKECLIM